MGIFDLANLQNLLLTDLHCSNPSHIRRKTFIENSSQHNQITRHHINHTNLNTETSLTSTLRSRDIDDRHKQPKHRNCEELQLHVLPIAVIAGQVVNLAALGRRDP
jgi:hypothetical protein